MRSSDPKACDSTSAVSEKQLETEPIAILSIGNQSRRISHLASMKMREKQAFDTNMKRAGPRYRWKWSCYFSDLGSSITVYLYGRGFAMDIMLTSVEILHSHATQQRLTVAENKPHKLRDDASIKGSLQHVQGSNNNGKSSPYQERWKPTLKVY